jgi:5-(carboxyamino)imidazole ribonucleotide synthase
MMIEAASPLGVDICVLRTDADESTATLGQHVIGDLGDPAALAEFARLVDVITFDKEPGELLPLLDLIVAGVELRPGPATLRFSDKARQRRLLTRRGLPIPPFAILHRPEDVPTALEQLGGDVIWKAALGGFDGRGLIHTSDPTVAADFVAGCRSPVVAEAKLQLDAELSVIVARDVHGAVLSYPTFVTVQDDGMCNEVHLDPDLDPHLDKRARSVATRVADAVGSVGVLAVELFVSDGRVLVNEIAPRPHNSGHLTIEATATSQFEQHIRAVLGLPLGPVHPVRPAAAMVNIAGDHLPGMNAMAAALGEPDTYVHLYGKLARPRRKVGHVTALADNLPTALDRARRTHDTLLSEPEEQVGLRYH